MQWFKELMVFLLFSGLLLMLVPETELKQFLRLVVGLLLIALMVQPLTGTGVLSTSNRLTARLRETWHSFDKARPETLGMDHLQSQADRLLEKGSSIMREQMENQTNRQLGALLSLFSGIDEAQVVTQSNAQGGVERVVVQLLLHGDGGMAEESGLLYVSEADGDGSLVSLVQPVLVAGHERLGPEGGGDPSLEPLVRRVRTWVADFYGIDAESVIVTTLTGS
ncbi:MAG: stage III sporulation protein AF [Firmicutes bacterium]|nr:stage III sporulation protein AF [Bacillota bacterium]